METSIDIKALRESFGWRQEQLAEFLGVDRSSVSRMENGRQPRPAVRKRLESLVANAPSSLEKTA
jgi:transcriptional regulator with XRE-family HTH domain